MFYYQYEDRDKGLQCVAEGTPVFVRRQKNGIMVRCASRALAQGILSTDGATIYRLEGTVGLDDTYAVARVITMAEYDYWILRQGTVSDPDPEDTEPEIPENVVPETVLTRAELTERVRQLEEELAAAKVALGLGQNTGETP